ncbi:hypothetical protein [Micromonospora zhanjiangensis]|uniref:Uncharacterized protein n=1 Tax=Micromonospora zhanjiangensis TaxID=1522057 RepID=A0ABV8KNP6_9ACTN
MHVQALLAARDQPAAPAGPAVHQGMAADSMTTGTTMPRPPNRVGGAAGVYSSR